MHDEDNKRGLMIKSPDRSDAWKCFGDGHLLDDENVEGLKQCILAVQASVDEVYEAWQKAIIPADKDFKAWTHAPIPESIATLNNPPPLFDEDARVRTPLKGAGPFTYLTVDGWKTEAAKLGFS
jgi:hypothetical protein